MVNMTPFYLSSFQTLRPKYEQAQSSILEWIAKAHTTSSFPDSQKDNEESQAFMMEILDNLQKIGLGPGKIEKRGIHCRDFSLDSWDDMDIFKVDKFPQGLGLQKRMDFFSNATQEVFEAFYQDKNLPSHLIHVTCTGYSSPSGAQKLVSKRNSLNTVVTNAFHMGCYGALTALRIGNGFVKNDPSDLVDVVHTELCSLHMNPSVHTKEQLVIESLFADGFAKYSITKQKKQEPSFRVLALLEEIIPESSEDMSWVCHDFGFSMHVAREVPVKIVRHLTSYLSRLVSLSGLSMEFLKDAVFAIHPGGPKIIEQLSKALELDPWQSDHSHSVLKSCGNMSSATLPHIWKKILEDSELKEGTFVVSLAFGPGLTISGSIFQKEF